MVIILLALDNQVKEEENREVDLEEVEEDQRRLRFKKFRISMTEIVQISHYIFHEYLASLA